MSDKPMIVRRYRVGIDLNKYARNFVIGCVVSAVASVAITLIAMLVIFNAKIESMTTEYEGEIFALNNTLATIQGEHQQELDMQESAHEMLVTSLQNQLDEVTEQYNTVMEASAADFDYYKQYWYIFRDAPANSGISLELIKYVDEKCKEWDVNPQWMWAIYDLETGMDPRLDNSGGSGARGLGQVMPSTGKSIWETILNNGTYTHNMAYDPFVNAEITITHIGRNLAIGSMSNAIQLYSGGGGSSYYNTVISKGLEHGVTLTEANAHYPY